MVLSTQAEVARFSASDGSSRDQQSRGYDPTGQESAGLRNKLLRRNDLDERGHLSEKALATFTRFFLETCIGQICACMAPFIGQLRLSFITHLAYHDPAKYA